MSSEQSESFISEEMWLSFERSAIWLDIKATLEIRLNAATVALMQTEFTDLSKVAMLQQEIRDLYYFINFPQISITAIRSVKEGQNE